MRARLYRGPHDGRVFEVHNTQRTIRLKRRARTGTSIFTGLTGKGNTWELQTVDDEYHVALVRHPDGSLRFAVHPDGSVYFEWSQPRGTRIKR